MPEEPRVVTVHQTDFPTGSLVKHRYFVALRPPPNAIRQIASVQSEACGADKVAANRLHMTLFITEDFESEPPALRDQMCAALDKVRAEAFDVGLHKIGHRGGSLVPSRAPALRRFQKSVADALAGSGVILRKEWAFNPHVTLGYHPQPAFAGQPIDPILWRATEFVLIHSLLRLTMHRTLGVWPLIEQPRLL
jgi:2'-5' RNA ligase